MASFALSLTALVLVALLLGVHITGHLILNPVLRAMDSPDYVPIKRAIDVAAPRLAKPLMLACLTAALAALIAAILSGAVVSVVVDVVALIALIVTLLVILRGDLPINRSMAGWSPSEPPVDWRATRARWERLFGFRVAANLLALLAIGVAVILDAAGLGLGR